MKTIAVLTSGGDAPGMNAAIRAVVRYGIGNGLKVMGIQRGYRGLINGEITELNSNSVCDIIQRGGTILRTARCKEFMTEEGRKKAYNILKVYGIDGLVVIGGDGSFQGARELSKLGIKTVGVPGTIDNDLAYTDSTIGFDTAANTALDAIKKLRDTSSSHGNVSIVEVMGRNCGDLALYAGVAGGALSIIVPEKEFDVDQLCKTLLEGKMLGKRHNLVILAEGVGGAEELSKTIQQVTGIGTRITILGHIQRGGSPTVNDVILASKLGAKAVRVLIEGKSSRVVGIKNGKIFDEDVETALTQKQSFDDELLNLASLISK